MSKKEVAKYSKSNHNVFDWLCKGRDKLEEKEKFEEIESNEIDMEVEEEDLIKEGRLQRVEKRKREFMSRRLVQDRGGGGCGEVQAEGDGHQLAGGGRGGGSGGDQHQEYGEADHRVWPRDEE